MVRLTLGDSPGARNPRDVLVTTVKNETGLRYLDWVQGRRETVERLSGGRVGYLHLPNTALEGYRELFRLFPPQIDKDYICSRCKYSTQRWDGKEMPISACREDCQKRASQYTIQERRAIIE